MEDINEAQVSAEDTKLIIEENAYLQYALKIMNDIPLDDDTILVDYEELWNKVALTKKIDAGEVTSDSVAFAYSLLETGLNNFGASFITHFGKPENVGVLAYCIKSILQAITEESTQEN